LQWDESNGGREHYAALWAKAYARALEAASLSEVEMV
jgi:hypothetical protein